MAKASLKANYFQSLLQAILNIGFPVFSFMYLARILGPESLGTVYFATSMSSLFAVGASLALPLYGTRAIAKAEGESDRNQTFTDIFTLNIISTFIWLLLYIVAIFALPACRKHIFVFLWAGVGILANLLSVDWLYMGIEKFRSLTLRSAMTKLFAIIAMLLLVRKPEDAWQVVAILSGTLLLYNGLGFAGSFSEVRWIRPARHRIQGHLRSLMKVAGATFASSLYVFFDSTLLGFLAGHRDVGLFTAATRIPKALAGILQTVGSSALPRLARLAHSGKPLSTGELEAKSLGFMLFMSLPTTAFLLLHAPSIIKILSGHQFLEATGAMRLTACLVLLMSVNHFFILQILFPQSGEGKMLRISGAAGLANLLLNLALIPRFGFSGTAVALVATEILSFSMAFYYARHRLSQDLFHKSGAGPMLAAVILASCLALVIHTLPVPFFKEWVSAVVFPIAFGVLSILFQVPIARELLDLVRERLKLSGRASP